MVSIIIALASISILYYTPVPIAILPVILLLNYLLFRRLLVTKKIKTIVTKSLRPFLWLIIALPYFYTVYTISLTSSPVFIACMAFCCFIYGALCYIEIQPEPNFKINNILAILFILVGSSFASLLLAYWHWPLPAVMLVVWLVSFLIALWWLLDFTNSPQILAALWGFVVLELLWLTSRWIILYQVPQIPIIISQFGAIVTALAYGWGGIYYHYKQRSLKRGIIFEYLTVTIVVFVVLLILSRWTTAS